jgi:hypothetical protein
MSDFEGAEINGKQFPFVRITIAEQGRIAKRLRGTFRDAVSNIFFPHRGYLRMWKKVRSIAFVKNWQWKYLRIIPQELRCSQIDMKIAGELQVSFFGYIRGTVSAYEEFLKSLNPSPIETNKEK